MKCLKILVCCFLVILMIHENHLISHGTGIVNNDDKNQQIKVADKHFEHGLIFDSQNDYANALKHYKMAYNIDIVHRPETAALDLNKIAVVHYNLGENQKALDKLEEALNIVKKVKHYIGLGVTLNNFGIVYLKLGFRQKAEKYFQNSLKIHREIQYRDGESLALNSLGGLYDEIGDTEKALDQYQQALRIQEELKNPIAKADIINNIGAILNDIGQKRTAIDYYNKALDIRYKIGDLKGIIITLNNIGVALNTQGKREKAIGKFGRSLGFSQQSGNKFGEALSLKNIGEVYYALGFQNEALSYYWDALFIYQKLKGKKGESQTLNNIGNSYHMLSMYKEALKYYQDSLNVSRSIKYQRGTATALGNIGVIISKLGKFKEAMDKHKASIAINRKINDRAGEASSLNSIGDLYIHLGNWEKSLKSYREALNIFRKIRYRNREAIALTNIGKVYIKLGNNQKGLYYYQKAVPIFREVDNTKFIAMTFVNIGAVFLKFGHHRKSLMYYKKALSLFKYLGNRDHESSTLIFIGMAYLHLGQAQKALEYCEKALPITNEIGDKAIEATTLYCLMACQHYLKNKKLAIFFGKLCVNTTQSLRANIASFKDKTIEQQFLESEKHTYRYSTELLIGDGRISEAQQILEKLKEHEYFKFINWIRSGPPDYESLDFTNFEKTQLKKYFQQAQRIANISEAYHILKFKPNKINSELKRLGELKLKLNEAKIQYNNFLIKLKTDFIEYQIRMNKKTAPPVLIRKARELQTFLNYLDDTQGNKNVALNYMVYDGRISIIVTTSTSQWVKQSTIDRNEFNRMIMIYKRLVVKLGEIGRGINPIEATNDEMEELLWQKKENDRKLYEAIFKPIDEELTKYGATNLIISLDGVLRYIPMATLWNGENYLLQRYRMAIITSSSLKNIKDTPAQENKILGFGAGNGGDGFSKLPYVAREIRSIVKNEKKGYFGLVEGKAFINDTFTKDAMMNHLKNGGYPMVHISSHFKFSPGDETKNKLLLGGGKTIKLSEIRREGKLFNGVKLLVLSACETGVGGNGEEIDGFGELAQQSGAKSVIASLWPVADESTKELMVSFYRNLTNEKSISKIEALRQAQLEMAGLEDLLANVHPNPHQSVKKKTQFSHSYYWGPFIMIGNWR